MQILFTLYGTGVQITGNNAMAFFMKKHGITEIVKLNYYPTGMTAMGCLAMWVYALLSDWLGTRVPASVAIGTTFIISGAIALAPGVGLGGKLFAFCTGLLPSHHMFRPFRSLSILFLLSLCSGEGAETELQILRERLWHPRVSGMLGSTYVT